MSKQRALSARSSGLSSAILSRAAAVALCSGLVVCTLLGGTRPATAEPPAKGSAGVDSVAPTLRLPKLAAPLRYALDLTLVPTEETFTGSVDIDLNVLEATAVLWLNKGPELTVLEASLIPGGRPAPGR